MLEKTAVRGQVPPIVGGLAHHGGELCGLVVDEASGANGYPATSDPPPTSQDGWASSPRSSA